MATALLFNFTDAQKLQKLRFALFKHGVTARVVDASDFGQPVGWLCALEGYLPDNAAAEGGFTDEMLVLCGLSAAQLDGLLTALRRSRAVVALKAVVTEENVSWSAKRLHDEILEEHEAMKGAHTANAEKRSAHRK